MIALLGVLLAAGEPAAPQIMVVPMLGGSSDLGFVMGAVGLVTQPSATPGRFDWQVAGQSSTSLKVSDDGVTWPLQRHYLRYAGKRLVGRTDLWTEIRYERILDSGFFGLESGGAERPPDPPNRTAYQYTSVEPHIRAQLSTPIDEAGQLRVIWGFDLKFSSLVAPADGLLAEAIEEDPPLGSEPHTTLQPYLAIANDTRDHPTWPRRGRRLLVSLRGAPGLFASDIAFLGTSLHWRRFLPIGARQVLGLRVWGDAIFGEAPFEELARGGDLQVTRMIGHSRAMRGIPAGRVHAPFKVLNSIEHRVRWKVWKRGGGRQMSLRSALFAEAGRGWTGADDPGGWAWAIGGGPRFHAGPGVVFRLDIAHSPMATNLSGGPITGVYVDLLESF